MAGYRSTQKISLWKQHQCVACASHYRYLFERELQGQGGTVEAAQENLSKVIQNSLATDVDFRPCPNCGSYQPDMSAQRERSRLLWLFIITPIVGLILIITGASGSARADVVLWITTLFGALMAAWLYLLESKSPNSDLRANQLTAQKAVNAGKLVLDQASPGFDPGRGGHKGMNPAMLGVLAMAVIIMPCAELVRVMGGWPLNPELHFPVVGPGDTSRLHANGRIGSVKSLWSADATVQPVNPAALPAEARLFLASSNKSSWGGTIRVKSSEKNSNSTPWMDIKFPAQPALAGQTVDLKTKLVVSYPKMQGTGYVDGRSTFEQNVSVKLAPAGAGGTYKAMWGTTLSIGILLITVLAVLAWRAAGKSSRNTQTQLIPIEPQAPPPAQA